MKKLINKMTLTLLVLPSSALALNINNSDAPNGTSNQGLNNLVGTISSTILAIIGVIAVLMLILGGFQYVASAGNPEQVSKAKNTILYAIIGIIVAILAFSVIKFVTDNIK